MYLLTNDKKDEIKQKEEQLCGNFSRRENDLAVVFGVNTLDDLEKEVNKIIQPCLRSDFLQYLIYSDICKIKDNIDRARFLLGNPSGEVVEDEEYYRQFTEVHKKMITMLRHDMAVNNINVK